MKLSIAIADTHALPSAFVVYRGFDACIPSVAALGFDGVELALRRADEVNAQSLWHLLNAHGLEVSCISTGQVYADGGLMLTEEDDAKRQQALRIFRELIDLAAEFGKLINIGRARGPIGQRSAQIVEDIFINTVRQLCAYAEPKGVSIILEPVNRYEIDFINNVDEAAALSCRVDRKNFGIMPDTFHMNIEDRSVAGNLAANIEHVRYIHLADSNRQAPGQGHIDFDEIFEQLLKVEYNGWVSVEILPRPDPDTAASRAAAFLKPLVRRYNERYNARLTPFNKRGS